MKTNTPAQRASSPLLRKCLTLASQTVLATFLFGCNHPQATSNSDNKLDNASSTSSAPDATSRFSADIQDQTNGSKAKNNSLKTKVQTSGATNETTREGSPKDSADDPDIPSEIISSTKSYGNEVSFSSSRADESFTINHTASGGTVKNKAGKELLQFRDIRLDDRKQVEVRSVSGQLLFRAKINSFNHIFIQNPEGKDIYLLRINGSNNTVQLQNGAAKYLTESCPSRGGLGICEYKSNNFQYHVFERDGKMLLLDKKDRPVLSCKEKVPFTVLTCFGLDTIDKNTQYALAYTLMFMKL